MGNEQHVQFGIRANGTQILVNTGIAFNLIFLHRSAVVDVPELLTILSFQFCSMEEALADGALVATVDECHLCVLRA
ncbi:hypothetical protein DSD19_00275 [Rhodovulum sp. BSW8]|nr:hypothetical protein DSD19_00275 [Rhodovulum sp. BSW8]